ncbi:MAG TPA: NAD(P)-dependent oxidoreductase [Stellaceae bacterium]|jgi:phosphoglycerate dehydrogenase-like enzyme|nr:NAD(P)-dependent oxidoreductase [Stellaceae bacterium]
MPYRVVVGDVPLSFGDFDKNLAAAGFEVVRLPADAREWTPALIRDYVHDAQALVGMFAQLKLPREVLAAGEKLRIVVSPVIGTEHIDVAAATELGIAVGYGATPENYLGVAEAIVMEMAMLQKNFAAKQAALREGGWRVPHPGHMIRGSTVGIIGFGNLGRGLARRLAGWECALLATDPYIDPAVAPPLNVRLVDLDTLLRDSDFVVLAVTLTDETRHMIAAPQFALMKPGAHLINAARGGVVDEAALLAALNEGRLAGAAIDTWEQEPAPADHPLRRHAKVLPTGHNVGHSEAAYASLPVAAVENTMRGLAGEPPLHFRNPDVLPKWRERLRRLGVNSGG